MHSDKCTVIAVASRKVTEADVIAFHDKRNLTVAINKSVKVLLNWNGRKYEGRAAGLDFESDGPKPITTYNSPRGR
jgi:hypothetical protein